MKKYRSSVQGFTLVELMVTVSVMVILGMMAAPALQSYLARSGMQTLQNDFTATLNLAKSEAASRNTCVSVCQLHKNNNAVSCEVDDAEAGQWHRGWVVYENPSCATLADSEDNPPTGSTILQVREPGSPRFTLTSKSTAAVQLDFTYNARGVLQNDAATLELKDGKDVISPYARELAINAQGRVLARHYSPAANPTAAGGTK